MEPKAAVLPLLQVWLSGKGDLEASPPSLLHPEGRAAGGPGAGAGAQVWDAPAA